MASAMGTLPLELVLYVAQHLAPLDLLALLRAAPGLSCHLTCRHVTNTDTNGWSILHHLAREGEGELMEHVLTNSRIAPDLKDSRGCTPLGLGAFYGHEVIVQFLLERQEVKPDSRDYGDGRTPLSHAASGGHVAIVKLLLGREEVEANTRDSRGLTPLSYAASGGYEKVVKLLLGREGIEVNPKDEYGLTPLALAAGGGHEAVIKLLLGREEAEADVRDCGGRTPLSYAAGAGSEAIVRLLLDYREVEADPKDEDGRTPLSYAAEGGCEAVIMLLLGREDVEADARDCAGRTPLSYAAALGYEVIVKLLLDRREVEANPDEYGWTPLSYAARAEIYRCAYSIDTRRVFGTLSHRPVLVDFTGEFTAALYGHSHPVIQGAVQQVIDNVGMNVSATTAQEHLFAKEICQRFGIDQVRFTNSGTEANLHALAAARHFIKKRRVVVFDGGYHGSFLSFAGGKPAANNVDVDDWILAKFNDVESSIRAIRSPDVAAVLVEGMQGAGGCICGTRKFLTGIQETASDAGVLFILDEVMTSRMSANGLAGRQGLRPDLKTFGKWLGGGVAFGAFGGRADIMAAFDPRLPQALPHSGTFNNNTFVALDSD